MREITDTFMDYLTDEEILDNSLVDVINFLNDEVESYYPWEISIDNAWSTEYNYDGKNIRVDLEIDNDKKVYCTINDSTERIYDYDTLKQKISELIK